jgi:MFS transporter, ACS family, glucarate transporter
MKYRHRLLLLLFLFAMMTFLDRVCISVAGPRMQQDLGIPPERWGWVLGAFAFAYAAFEMPMGMMGDRFGARRILTRIVLLWSAFTALTGMVSNYYSLVATRFAFGLGEAGAFPNASASISRWFPAAERARAQGWIWMATRFGAAIASFLVVPIQIAYGWRAAFWIFGALGVVWACVWYWWYRDEPSQKPGISSAELAEIGQPAVRGRHLLPWRVALRSSNLRALMLMYFCFSYGAHFFITWLHTYLVKSRGFSEKDLAIFSPLPFVFGAVANLGGGFLSDILVRRWGLKIGRRVCGVGGLAASGLLILSAALSSGKYSAILLLALAYACSDLMMPTAWAVCLDIGKSYAGAVSGAMNTAGQLGSFTSAVVFGYLVKAFHSYDLPLVSISIMLLISAAQWFRIDPTRELEQKELPVEAAEAIGS